MYLEEFCVLSVYKSTDLGETKKSVCNKFGLDCWSKNNFRKTEENYMFGLLFIVTGTDKRCSLSLPPTHRNTKWSVGVFDAGFCWGV